ncbi:MAG: hypothetical protein Q9220_005486 [cf. Caloplaca sp. 1 TL-2023]
MSCLITWVSGGSSQCPFCRSPIDTSREAREDQDERENIVVVATTLTDWSSRFLNEWLGADRILEIKRVESLWDTLCAALLDHMEAKSLSRDRPLSELIRTFALTEGPAALKLLGFGNAYNFISALTSPYLQYRLDNWILTACHEPYQELMGHLKAMGAPTVLWKTYLAFERGPDLRLTGYMTRLQLIETTYRKRVDLDGLASTLMAEYRDRMVTLRGLHEDGTILGEGLTLSPGTYSEEEF